MNSQFSFKKGWDKLPNSKTREVKSKIMVALKMKVASSFYSRLYGKVEPKISEARQIEDIFKEYGVTDIWGE